MLKNTGFTLEVDRDITANVLLSCDEVARARVGAYDAGNDPELMNNFLAAPGSQVYEDMRTGRWSYRIYRFRKPEAERPGRSSDRAANEHPCRPKPGTRGSGAWPELSPGQREFLDKLLAVREATVPEARRARERRLGERCRSRRSGCGSSTG